MKSSRMAVVAGLIALCSACSTYKTNSDIEFDSIWLSGQEPAIHVGDVEATSDQLTYLGWVDAKVSRPSPMHEAPSKEQADIVLAHEAQKLGAHAVIHVTYHRGVLTEITARGQAVLINDEAILAKMAEARRKKHQNELYRAPKVLSPAAVVEKSQAPVSLTPEPEPATITNPEPEIILSPAAAPVTQADPMAIPEAIPSQTPATTTTAASAESQAISQTQAASNPQALYFGPLYQPPSAEKLKEMAEKTRHLMEKAREYRDQEMFNDALELYHFIYSQKSF